jgi:hypothetical protein
MARTLGEGNHHMARTGVPCVFLSFLLGALPGCAGGNDDIARMQAYLRRNSAVVPSTPEGAFEIPSGIFDDVIDRHKVISESVPGVNGFGGVFSSLLLLWRNGPGTLRGFSESSLRRHRGMSISRGGVAFILRASMGS